MSSTARKTVVTTAKTVIRSPETRRKSPPLSNDDLPARPTKRARITKDETLVESQMALIDGVAGVMIEGQETLVEESVAPVKAPKGGRKRKVAAEPSPADYQPRNRRDWKVGAHISAAGGIENAVVNAAKIGAESFALFMKNQKQWVSKDLTPESISRFKSRMGTFGYDLKHVLPHGSYLVNLGNPDKEKRDKAYQCFLDDLTRCEQVGVGLYNFHPGSTVKACTPEESIAFISECLNKAHKATESVVTVIENMAGAGGVIGGTFEQLAQIIAGVEDKARVGVCIDTCEVMTFEQKRHMRQLVSHVNQVRSHLTSELVAEFGTKVGFQYLKGLHLNDSKTPLNSKKDRHEHLGMGHIGLKTFGFLMRDERMKGLPMILETITEEVWPKEIEILQRMADPATPEEQLDFEGMAGEIRLEVKKYEKETAKEPKKKKDAAPKKAKAAEGKKGKKDDSEEEGAGESDED